MNNLTLKNISFEVTNPDRGVHSILKDINFEIKPGEFVTLFGKSGCGKSTLMNIISGLENKYSGDVLLDGNKTENPGEHISFVFQEDALFSFRTVQQNVEFGLELKGIGKSERTRTAEELLKKVGLFEHRKKYPMKDKLSGGMKQRVEIASVLSDQSAVILMDEPFSALDDITREEMQQFLLDVWEEFGKTILFVTHNKDEAIILSDRIFLMSNPNGSTQVKELQVNLDRPRNQNTIEFLRYRNILTEHLKFNCEHA